MAKNNPLVSIVTTCYNSEKYIEECLQSVLHQDHPYVEHIIQDGASTDNTLKILKKYKKKKTIRIFSEPDKGQTDGLNKAIQKAKGDILLVLNADDALLPNACSWAVENMKRYPETAVIYGDLYIMNEKSEIQGIHIHSDYSFAELLCIELIPPAQAAFVRRSTLEKVGFWVDSTLDTCPDFEMWVRIASKYLMKHVYGVVTKYRVYNEPQLDSKKRRGAERFVAAKREVMGRLFNSPTTPKSIKKLKRRAYAGLDLWASREAFALKQPRLGVFYLLRSFYYKPSQKTFLRIYQTFRMFFYFFLIKIRKKITILNLMDKLKIYIETFKKKLALKTRLSFEDVHINKVENFWDRHPCNVRHSDSKINTKKYFDEIEERKYFVEPHIPHFAQFSKWKGKKVLEIGYGIGTDTINFARAGAYVDAIEISKKSLEIAKKRARIFKLQNKIKFYLGNAEELSSFLPVKSYDLIYSFGVIHHTPHPYKVIEEIRKYIHRDTLIKIMVYHRYSWKVLWMLFKYGKGAFWRIGEIISKYSEAAIGSPVTYTYTKKQAKELLRGFKIIDMKVDHTFPYSISEYRQYKYKKVWYFRYLPKPIFRWLETHLGWHLLITAKA